MLDTFRDLGPYLRRHRVAFLLGITLLVGNAFLATLIPIIPGRIIDGFQSGMTMPQLLSNLAMLVGLALAGALIMVFVRRLILGASWEIQFWIRHDIFKHFTVLDGNYFDNTRVGDLMARLTADLNAVRMLIGVAIMMGCSTATMIGFTVYRMVSLSPSLALLTIAVVPFISLTFFILLRIIHRRYTRVQEQFSEVSAMAQENFSGIRVVKGFGIEHREMSKFAALNDEFVKRNLALTRVDGPLHPLMEFLFGLTVAMLVLVGGRLVLGVGSELTIGEFSSFILLFEGIQWPLVALGWIGNMAQRGSTSWGRLKEILASVPEVTDGPDTDYSLTEIKGDIEFRNVSVSFDGVKALDDVSFHIRAGESIGITGRTGSGKTLVVQLITRLVNPDAGEILIDGIDYRRYPIEVIRRYIGLVPQEPFLFSDSIAENIAYGVPEASLDELEPRIREAAGLAQLVNDVDDFPLGFKTALGERGVTLSGGQRQRTAIARALIRDPRVLIFDDALSAVDTQTETLILSGLKHVQSSRTSVVVAHRISAFQNVDRIYVLELGRIVEQGTHDELIALGGRYADINERQQLEAEVEAA